MRCLHRRCHALQRAKRPHEQSLGHTLPIGPPISVSADILRLTTLLGGTTTGANNMRCAKMGLLFLAILCIPQARAALLPNGDFESGTLLPWFQDRNLAGPEAMDWRIVTAEVHSGLFSAMCVGNLELRQNLLFPTPASAITEASFWIRQPNSPPGAAVGLILFYTDSTWSQNVLYSRSTDWISFDFRGLLTPGRTLSAVSLFGYSSMGQEDITFLDDFRLTVVPEPSTITLFSVAVLSAFMFVLIKRRNQ